MAAVAVPTKLSQLDQDIVIDEDDMASDSATQVPTQQSVKAYVDASGGGGGGLSEITETLQTASPNNTVNAESLQVTGGTTNVDLVLGAKGTGAYIFGSPPDGSTPGGDKRGIEAIDLQTSRASAGQVAKGDYQVVIGSRNVGANYAFGASVIIGRSNTDGGGCMIFGDSNNSSGCQLSVVLGRGNAVSGVYGVAVGTDNSVNGDHVVCIGNNCSATSTHTVALGRYGVADRYGMVAYANGRFSTSGDTQEVQFLLRCKTTTNAAVEMALDGGSAYLTIPSGKMLSGILTVQGIKSDGSAAAVYLRQVALANVGGTTALVGSANTIGTDTAAGTTLAVTADDTGDYLSVKPTGITSETWRWTATFIGVETAYGS